jgi:hypothetical protein
MGLTRMTPIWDSSRSYSFIWMYNRQYNTMQRHHMAPGKWTYRQWSFFLHCCSMQYSVRLYKYIYMCNICHVMDVIPGTILVTGYNNFISLRYRHCCSAFITCSQWNLLFSLVHDAMAVWCAFYCYQDSSVWFIAVAFIMTNYNNVTLLMHVISLSCATVALQKPRISTLLRPCIHISHLVQDKTNSGL